MTILEIDVLPGQPYRGGGAGASSPVVVRRPGRLPDTKEKSATMSGVTASSGDRPHVLGRQRFQESDDRIDVLVAQVEPLAWLTVIGNHVGLDIAPIGFRHVVELVDPARRRPRAPTAGVDRDVAISGRNRNSLR